MKRKGVGSVPFDCRFEPLGETLSICVTPDHKFGTDAFLLSHFARVRRKDLACDLCTGCGIVALLWFRDREQGPRQAYCVEIQPKAVEQLKITVEKNALQDRVIPIQGDLTCLSLPPAGQFDLVTCNPPYKAAATGILSETGSDQLARHETACSIYDVCAAAARLLKFGGRFCLCQRPERLPDVLEAMRQNGLEPKRLRFVQQREGSAPWLFLAEGKRGSRPFLQVEAPLIIEGPRGFSEELLTIYGKM